MYVYIISQSFVLAFFSESHYLSSTIVVLFLQVSCMLDMNCKTNVYDVFCSTVPNLCQPSTCFMNQHIGITNNCILMCRGCMVP
jgi:hypothetical protein